jgi:uncharacterized protein (TIGR03083 family)
MNTITTQDVRRPSLDHRTAMRLARTEYGRFADLLATLGPDDWTRPTDCPAWDVRAMASHVLGMAALAASIREGARQRKLAAAADGVFIDELTALQVRERLDMPGDEIARHFGPTGRKAARGRRMTPPFVRNRQMPVPQEVNGSPECWSIGYLTDIILTRDTWMHRIDIARATGKTLVLTPDHDGTIVADVVAEWADRHGQPYQLSLSGPAGGSWSTGSAGETISVDAVEFCRAVAGRAAQPGLLGYCVPF